MQREPPEQRETMCEPCNPPPNGQLRAKVNERSNRPESGAHPLVAPQASHDAAAASIVWQMKVRVAMAPAGSLFSL
jgi:hypothetical protein